VVAVAEERQAPTDEAAAGRVDEVEGTAGDGGEDDLRFIQHDPPGGTEAGVMLVAPGVGGDGAPVVANGAQVRVAVEVVGGQEAVGNAVDEVRRERRPVRCRHGLDRPSWAPGCRDLFVVWCCANDVGEESRG